MRIEKLHIYGFGKHENVQIELQPGMTVFYGENEAGKSSIQQFILHILFGFPQKNAQLLRFEPKSGATYGGRVQLVDEKMGRVIIERVKGKASGDVTLYFEDGTRGGESDLTTLLHAYSRTDFEAIFSFSLLQLQGFEKMTEEELTRTLLSSGTTGMDALSSVEAQFAKEMGELFKPSGKKPAINQKIEEVRSIEAEWTSYLEEVSKYESSIKRLKEIETILNDLSEKEALLKKDLQRYIQWKQLMPIKKKQIELTNALEKVQYQTFPTDGIRRLEGIKDKETNVNITLNQLNEHLRDLSNQNESMSKAQLDSLQSFLAYETEWHQLKAKRLQIEEEHTKTLQNQMQQIALVGIDSEKNLENVLRVDVSIQQEEKLVSYLKNREQLESTLLQENRLLQMKTKDLEEQRARIQDVKNNRKSSSEQNNTTRISSFLSSIILLVGITLSFLQSNWLIALFATIASIIVFAGFHLMRKTMYQSNDVKTYASLLVKEEQALKLQVSQLENDISEFEREIHVIDHNVQAFLESYYLNNKLSPHVLKELFNRLRTIQEQQIQLDQMDKQLYEVTKRIQELFEQAKSIDNIPLLEDMLFYQLREHYLNEKKKQEQNETTNQTIQELTLKQKENMSLLLAYSQSKQELYQEAKVDTENEFYAAFQLFEQKVSLEKDLHQLRLQLGNYEIEVDDFEEAFEKESNVQLEEIQHDRNVLLEEKASLQYKTNKLLIEDQQSEILQNLEQKKTELNEYVKKWASYKAVVEAIKQMMSHLKEERLPAVLENAQNIFQSLTANSYEQLILTPEGVFEAVKANGQRFKIAELSQATKEQAYISLRVALALSLKNTTPFPIIMDDPFVHFDRFRLQQVVQLMKKLQKEHQLLYFTCHEDMQYIWEDVNVIQVAGVLAGSGGIVK